MLPSSSSETVTSIVHFYRGELSRMVAWRDRLDRTTNWAIAASAAMLSVALSSPESHHGVILCCMALVFLLMGIEARRYRYFHLSRQRVRLLEVNYYAPMLSGDQPAEGWRRELSESVANPQFSMSMTEALANRLRRNYMWIYLTLALAWWLKVSTRVLNARTGDAEFVHSVDELLNNADVSYIPGWLVVIFMTAFIAWICYMVGRHRAAHDL